MTGRVPTEGRDERCRTSVQVADRATYLKRYELLTRVTTPDRAVREATKRCLRWEAQVAEPRTPTARRAQSYIVIACTRYEEVIALRRKGQAFGPRANLHLSRNCESLCATSIPERARATTPTSLPLLRLLSQRWMEGCTTPYSFA